MQSRARRIVATVVVAFTLALGIGLAARPASAEVQVNIGFFFDRLAPYGHWFTHKRYGYVWYPIGVGPHWRPYTHGHWEWLPDHGWYWDADEEWGWGPYHYGRWVYDDDYGWVWVPGYVWAPAWVLWRRGPGYVGWAPMPPRVRWTVGMGLNFGDFDPDEDRFGPSWIFVDDRRFLAPRLHEVILSPARNLSILRLTKHVTRYGHERDRVVNHGLRIDQVEKMTRSKVKRFKLRDVDRPAMVHREQDDDGTLPVFRPKVEVAPQLMPAPPLDDRRRWESEERNLDDYYAAEQERLNRHYKLERERTKQDRQRLQRQQDDEFKWLQKQQSKEKQQLRNRRKLLPYERDEE